MSNEGMAPSDEAMALVHLILPWVIGMSEDELVRLKSNHGQAERMMEASLWVANNTHVPLCEIDYDAFVEAVNWSINSQCVVRSKVEDSDDD